MRVNVVFREEQAGETGYVCPQANGRKCSLWQKETKGSVL